MNTKSSINTFLYNSKAIASALLLGATLTLNAPIVADASVTASNADQAKQADVAKQVDKDEASHTDEMGFIHQSDSQKKALSEKWGIELVAMRSTAAGHMVDFRYRVLNAEKAAPLFKRQTKPYLIHQESGKALAVPNTAKIGSLRNSNTPQAGRIYWMFFGNHHGLVQKGDKVTVAIGDFRAKDLKVQ
jgi:hypothetical protein